jgi:anti-anti-sigma factor
MPSTTKLFETECRGDVAIVTATDNLSEFAYEALEREASEVLSLLQQAHCRHVVVDLGRTDYVGSTALGLFLKLWKLARSNQGNMAVCGLSENEREVFATMKLDALWPIRDTLEEALAAVRR